MCRAWPFHQALNEHIWPGGSRFLPDQNSMAPGLTRSNRDEHHVLLRIHAWPPVVHNNVVQLQVLQACSIDKAWHG